MSHTCASFDHEGARFIFNTHKAGYRIFNGRITHELKAPESHDDDYDGKISRFQGLVDEEKLTGSVVEFDTSRGKIVGVPVENAFGKKITYDLNSFLKASRAFIMRNDQTEKLRAQSDLNKRSNVFARSLVQISIQYGLHPCRDKNIIEAIEEYFLERGDGKSGAHI